MDPEIPTTCIPFSSPYSLLRVVLRGARPSEIMASLTSSRGSAARWKRWLSQEQSLEPK
jgi:hypothetical protein